MRWLLARLGKREAIAECGPAIGTFSSRGDRRPSLACRGVSDAPLLRKVDCLALRVADLDEALAFYGRLGHELIWRTATAAGLRLPDSEAELVVQTDRPGPETDLTVENVGQAIERFVAAGGRVVVEPFDIRIGHCAVVADPWDNHLVLLDNSKGILVTDKDGNVIGTHDSK